MCEVCPTLSSGLGSSRQPSEWDQNQVPKTDQATAALTKDLKQLGLLEETLVVWSGEFGRTVNSQPTYHRIIMVGTITPDASPNGWQELA